MLSTSPRLNRRVPTLVLTALIFAAPALAQPAFEKSFQPDTIGPGSSTRLTFTITNTALTPVTDLAFTDTLPAGQTIAIPASAATTCTDAVLSAPDGGTTITLSGGSLGASASCTVGVNVTATDTGLNVSGDLMSSAGNSGPAAATLTVDKARPGFSKSFDPDTIAFPGRSTLIFVIDNTDNDGSASGLVFSDQLPSGMVVANPSFATTDCPFSAVTATPGTSSISFSSGGSLAGGASCTVSVDVTTTTRGRFANVSDELFSGGSGVSSGFATAALNVPLQFLNKAFVDDPVPPGGTVELEFTLQNPDRDNAATGISFDDDLESVVSGLAPSGPLPTGPCGTGSALAFSAGVLSLTGGNLPGGGSCTFSVFLLVPAATDDGAYGNTTTPVMATIDDSGVKGNTASDTLYVVSAPIVTKEFTDDPVGQGGTVTLEFTITNPSPDTSISSIEFFDELTAFLPFPLSTTLPPSPNPPCGASSSLVLLSCGTDCQELSFTGGSLAAAASCTFSVGIEIPAGFPGGTYTNVTSVITGLLGGEVPVAARPASGDLVVVAAPELRKEFIDDPSPPGGTATLRFTLTNLAVAPAPDATSIAFTDDLTTVLSGLTATSVVNNCAGATVDISTPTTIVVSGGTLAAGASCAIDVELTVPAGANPGGYTNTTSAITATVAGIATTGNPATDDLRVAGLFLAKEFTDDPTIPGDTVNLSFTLNNTSGVADATTISFTDDLDAALSGLMAVAPLPTPCGGTLTGTSTLSFSGGSVTAGNVCTFDVSVLVPAVAADGSYVNVTSALQATIGGTPLTLDPANDQLVVDSELLSIAKSFTNDPTVPGGTVTLELTVTNLDAARSANAIDFSDDLGAALPGLTIHSVLQNGCGGVLAGVGTGMLTYTGGSLAAGASCKVRLRLDVPPGPLPGNTFTNTTSGVSGTIDGFPVSGPPASDDLEVFTLVLGKSFAAPTVAGGTVVLTFTIDNLDSSSGASALSFSDSLPAGLSALGLPSTDVCGTGSSLAGTTFLTFSSGSLGPGGSCTFDVTLQVPAGASPGDYVNTTSSLFSSGLPVAGPASATLEIEPPPTFTKTFAPASIGSGQTSVLTFDIDNSGSTLAADDLAFTDDLPAAIAITGPAAVNGCGGTLTAVAGTGTISLTGGSVGPGGSCVIDVNVTSVVPGSHVNTTGDLTSSSGNSGTASDTLVVNPAPGFGKAFEPSTIPSGGTSRLTFTIDNGGSTVAATDLAFTDNLPAAITVALIPSVFNDCGGTVTATAGSGTISLSGGTVGAGLTCTVEVDATSAAAGTHTNTSGDLTSSLGSSGPAADDLTVVDVVVGFTKDFDTNPVLPGGLVDVRFRITNTSAFELFDIEFTDDLSDVVPGLTAIGLPEDDVCGTGSEIAGTTTLTFTGGRLPPLGSCDIVVTLQVPADAPLGAHVNTTGPLTAETEEPGPGPTPTSRTASSLRRVTAEATAGAAPATATLIVAFLEIEKSFDPATVAPGGATTLTLTLTNPDPANGATDITFTDDLDAFLPGVAAVGLPDDDVCGTGSQIAGTTVLTLTGGSLGAGATCTFSVTLAVPAGAADGSFTNVTSAVDATVGGLAVTGDPADAATAVLSVSAVVPIPTLGELGLALLAGLLLLVGVRRLRLA